MTPHPVVRARGCIPVTSSATDTQRRGILYARGAQPLKSDLGATPRYNAHRRPFAHDLTVDVCARDLRVQSLLMKAFRTMCPLAPTIGAIKTSARSMRLAIHEAGAVDATGMAAEQIAVSAQPKQASLADGLGTATPAACGVLRQATCMRTVSCHIGVNAMDLHGRAITTGNMKTISVTSHSAISSWVGTSQLRLWVRRFCHSPQSSLGGTLPPLRPRSKYHCEARLVKTPSLMVSVVTCVLIGLGLHVPRR